MSHRRDSRVAPTHHELIAVKKELSVARKGEHILERHRDGLVFVLLDLLDRWKSLWSLGTEKFQEASDLSVWGMEREGGVNLRELSNARATCPELIIGETKLLGLSIPFILSNHISTPVADRGYGILGTSALDDELVTSYEEVLEIVVRLAEMKAVISQLLSKIRRLRIRVNYLTHRLIPELESKIQFIQRYLDEREKEERYRQLRIRKRKREHKQGHRSN